MTSNLGFLFYKSIYAIKNENLVLNDQIKRQLLDRVLNQNEKEYPLKNLDIFSIKTTYPGLTTGVGMPHGIKKQDDDFKIGFYFDHTTGLPSIPGSSVKGILRSAFPEIKKIEVNNKPVLKITNKVDDIKTKWIISLFKNLNDPEFTKKHFEPVELFTDKELEEVYKITLLIFEGVKDHSKLKPKDRFFSIYQRDIFYDAIITKPGKAGKILSTDVITPHVHDGFTYHESMLKNPKPLLFLKVLPKVEFTFHFSLSNFGLAKEIKIKLFKHILLSRGIGAKTNLGYGQFTEQ